MDTQLPAEIDRELTMVRHSALAAATGASIPMARAAAAARTAARFELGFGMMVDVGQDF